MSKNLQAAVQRVLAGNRDEGDLRTIVAAIQARQVVLVPGSGAVGIGGNVENSPIVPGHSNVIGDNNLVIYGAEAEEIQALLAQRVSQQARSFDELVLQVRKRCCDKVLKLYSKIQLLNRQQIDIGRLYVDVYVLEKLSSISHATIPGLLKGKDLRESFDRLGLGKREKRSCGLEVAVKHSRLMVFGKPGSGKSTFLRHLAAVCAKGEFLDDFIPVLFELRFVKEGARFNLLEILQREFRLSDQAEVEKILDQVRVLLLLDGLDEVPAQSLQAVQDHILEFTKQYYEHRIIVSCRTQTTEYILPEFEPIEVADFNPDQVRVFAENWFSLLAETCEEGETLKQRFLARLHEHQPMAELAVTPILLSLTCWVFGDLKNLPLRQSGLYEQGICLLLRQWDEQRGVKRGESSEIYHKLSLKERQKLLSYVAVRKFEQLENFVLFEESEICDYIAEHLQASVEESWAVLQAITEQHGLLIERAQGIWSFSHLTFQEYLAAKWFCDQTDLQGLVKHITETHWKEVFLLTAEMLPNLDELLWLMKAATDRFLADDEKLQQFLVWVNEKSLSVDAPYSHSVVRAFYFDLTLGLQLAIEDGAKLAYNTALNSDFSLPLTLCPDFALNFVLDRDRDFTRNDFDLASDYLLHCTLCLIIDRTIEIIYKVCKSSQTDSDLKRRFQQLLDELPEEKEEFDEWLGNSEPEWYDELRSIVIEHRNIGHYWEFTETHIDLLQEYYGANKLLVECMNQSEILSATVERGIEETLLLPLAEIEKRKKQSSD